MKNIDEVSGVELPSGIPEGGFKVGDVVEWCGVRAKVNHEGDDYVEVLFRVGSHMKAYRFSKQGHFADWHEEPSLKFISRPKKKVTKTIELWGVILPSGMLNGVFTYKPIVTEDYASGHILIRLTGTYEVEE